MKKILLAFLVFVLFSNCNKTSVNKCCTGAPQIVYADSSYIAMPDLYTPNGDGVNDQLMVLSKNIVSLKCTITKRFGKVVSSWNDTNSSWDGKFNGKDQREKTYSYTIEATTTSGNALSLSGDIAVIRDNCANGSFEECFFATQFNYLTGSFDRYLPSGESLKACN